MEKIAAIDIGTNSVLYSLFDIKSGPRLKEIYFARESPRLGGELYGKQTLIISPARYRTLVAVLRRFVRHARKEKAAAVLLAATNPLRRAANGKEIRLQLEKDLGQKVSVLSSAKEAYLSFLGAVGTLREDQTAVVIDMGGGSTELVVYRGAKRQAFLSVPEGAVSLTERFGTAWCADAARFPEYELYLSRYNKRIRVISPNADAPVFLVGGTSSALGYLKAGERFFLTGRIDLTEPNLAEFVYMLAAKSLAERRRLLVDDPKRAEIIFAGAFWLWHLYKTLPLVKARATSRGLRHGMALDFLTRRAITS
jgi:exopolyphosphatase / guanosine-5'-triphosphate,3'-diphosphate pyrophosphatase